MNSAASWLTWQGYFLALFGGKDGVWASANLGVLVALVIGFVAALLVQRGDVRRQESAPARDGVGDGAPQASDRREH